MIRDVHLDVGPVRISSLTCSVVTDADEFVALRGDWNRLASMSGSMNALHEWEYLITWWKSFGECCPKTNAKGNLHVIMVRNGEEVVGILPFFWMKPRNPLMSIRLRPLGYSGRLEPYDLTEEPLVAISPLFGSDVISLAYDEIAQGLLSGKWDCAILRWFGEPTKGSDRFWTRFKKKVGSAYVFLPDDWCSFRKGLSKSMRDNLPYYGKLLTRHGHEWNVEIAEIGPDWGRALSELVRLHKMRASFSNDPCRVDHFSFPAHREFFDHLHDAFRGDTRAFIGSLRVDGEVVAAQIYLDNAETLIFSYSGHDPSWSKYSPLLVLQAEIIKRAIDRGVQRLDLLCGEAEWQERWKPTRDFPINKLTLASKRPLSTLRCAYYLFARETTIYWTKTRMHRWLRRQRVAATLESLAQAMYMGHGRHIHMLIRLHQMRMHY